MREQLEVLRTIDTETDRLDVLVANLLDMSRIEAGVLQAKPESVDLAEVVTKEVDAAAVRWPGIEVDLAVDERHASATADPGVPRSRVVEPAGQRGPRLRRSRRARTSRSASEDAAATA